METTTKLIEVCATHPTESPCAELYMDTVVKIVIEFRKSICWLRRDIDKQSAAAAAAYVDACTDIYKYSPELKLPVQRTLRVIADMETFEPDWDWKVGDGFLFPIIEEFASSPLQLISLMRVLLEFDERKSSLICAGIICTAVKATGLAKYLWDVMGKMRKIRREGGYVGSCV